MTPARLAAEQTWAEDPRVMTPEVAAALAQILPDGDEEEAQATSPPSQGRRSPPPAGTTPG